MNQKAAGTVDRFDEVLDEMRGFGVHLESVEGNVQLIAEQYGGIANDIAGIKGVLGGHSKTLAIHTEMIGRIATDMDIVKEDIREIRVELRIKVDRPEFEMLEQRTTALEKKR